MGSITCAVRGKNLTVVCAANACSNYIPHFFIFPRVKINPLFMDQAPSSSQGFAQISGWMTMKLFKKYMDHFCKFVKPTINKPVLMILDGHCSHTKSIDVLDYASDNGIVMLAPPLTRHIDYNLWMMAFSKAISYLF